MDKFIKIANEEALTGALANDGGPFGAVITKDDEVISRGHNEVLKMSFGFSLPVMPQIFADILTVAAIIGITFITLRRIALSEVRILTTWYDYFILALAGVAFMRVSLLKSGMTTPVL